MVRKVEKWWTRWRSGWDSISLVRLTSRGCRSGSPEVPKLSELSSDLTQLCVSTLGELTRLCVKLTSSFNKTLLHLASKRYLAKKVPK